ncbi:MAG: methionyl-tRNA formyltransferase, partial [Patescibacteria group bacterium]
MQTGIVFFGSSPFSVVALQKLVLSEKCSVLTVVTTPDKPVGRHLKLTPNPVKAFAEKHHLPVFTDVHDFLLSDLPANTIALVAAHGRRLGPKTLSKFNNQVYVIHPSLLPKYRGPSPLPQQILDGVTKTGVTLIQADLGEDTGPIVTQEKTGITSTSTTVTLGVKLFTLGADLFIKFLLDPNHYHLKPQDNALASYTHKLTRANGFLPFAQFTSALESRPAWL